MSLTTESRPAAHHQPADPCESGEKSLKVWLVRHGQSESNAGQRSIDPVSIPLTTLGRAQVEAVTAALQDVPAKIVVSDYLRSRESGEIVRQRFPGVPLEVWPVQEFTYLSHEAYYQTTAQERQSQVEHYWLDSRPHEILDARSESFAQFLQRVLDVKQRLLSEPNGPVIIVSHKKFLSALLWTLLTGENKISARRMKRYRGFDLGMSLKNGTSIPLVINHKQTWIGSIRLDHLPKTS